jgi:FlaG/FlaF family flagellin (archaellin)
VAYVLSYVLALVLSIAVGVMLAWHISSIARGETTVESHDHNLYRRTARARGEASEHSVLYIELSELLCRRSSIHMMLGELIRGHYNVHKS